MKHPLLTAFTSVLLATQALAADFTLSPDWAKLPAGGPQLGNMHGDVAVSSKNETYVSVMDPAHGILVFGADGRLARALTGAPNDFHGFLIHRERDGEFIYGARLTAQTIVKLTLDGKVVLEIPASAIPDRVKMLQPEPAKGAPAPAAGTPAPGTPLLRLTGMAVAPNGDLYVTDGYATSNVHRFDRTGKYLATFGGKDAPYGFKTLHKIVIDPRFTPARLLGCDRENMRLVHLSLEGDFLGVYATDLLRPSALAIHGDLVAVGELRGRVTLLDKAGKVVTTLGTNSNTDEVATNRTDSAKWRAGIFNAAHGVAFNARGDLLVSEWTLFGRMHRFDRK